jgi:fructosamine-3-kinase
MESYFFENYVEKYEQPIQNDVGLKMKFYSLYHGLSTKREQRSKYEEKTKKIQKKI